MNTNDIVLATPQDPIEKKIIHRRGDDFEWIVNLYQKDLITPYDATNHTVLMQVKEDPTGSVVIMEVGANYTIGQGSGGVNNVITLNIPNTDTIVDPGVYDYDLQLTDGNGFIFTPYYGTFRITQDTSR